MYILYDKVKKKNINAVTAENTVEAQYNMSVYVTSVQNGNVAQKAHDQLFHPN